MNAYIHLITKLIILAWATTNSTDIICTITNCLAMLIAAGSIIYAYIASYIPSCGTSELTRLRAPCVPRELMRRRVSGWLILLGMLAEYRRGSNCCILIGALPLLSI